ncbi:MAG: hypothetical protein EP335_18905 [Alphaproteobacteria bacterium]|nr:MAG: hypothetical protein EP335_18905 [Alphaproteobacteria bacterium]
MIKLDDLRHKVVRILLVFLWAHVPAAFVHGWWADSEHSFVVAGVIALAALIATLGAQFAPPVMARMLLAVAMTVAAGALVALYDGHPWQKDVHLYFATVIALLSSTFCWRTLVTAAVTTALYYLLMLGIAPSLLFPDGGGLLEAGFNIVAFSVLTAGLMWVTTQVRGLFTQVEAEHAHAVEEADKARAAGELAEQSAREAFAAAERATAAKEEADALRAAQAEAEARAQAEKRALLDGLAAEFEASVQDIVHDVVSMASGMKAVAAKLQAQAKEGIQGAAHITHATRDASSNVDAVSGAATELSGSTSEISRQVDQTSRLTAEAVSQAENIANRIEVLSERAQEIGSVVSLITEIAEQTNLLALNATIEAARAGEVGKGFAVVATEVKNLAGESAKAADGIHTRIGGVQDATDDAVKAIRAINDMIRDINVGATAIAAAVEEQDAATRDIARSVQQASEGTRSAADNAHNVENQARQSEAEAVNVLSAIDQLEALAGTLGKQTDQFLARVRGA